MRFKILVWKILSSIGITYTHPCFKEAIPYYDSDVYKSMSKKEKRSLIKG